MQITETTLFRIITTVSLLQYLNQNNESLLEMWNAGWACLSYSGLFEFDFDESEFIVVGVDDVMLDADVPKIRDAVF